MGVDLTTLLAGVTGGAQGLAHDLDLEEARKRRSALDAMTIAEHQAQMAKLAGDTDNQQLQRFVQGFRRGTAPDGAAINAGLDVAAGAAGAGLPGAAGVTPSLAVQAMRAADPDQYAPDRFQQVTPTSYVDRTATPEAVHQRAMQGAAAEAIRRALILQANRPDRTQLRNTDHGLVRVNLDTGDAEPVTLDDTPLHAPPSRAAQSGEAPEHRNARQGLAAVNSQLRDTRSQISTMNRSAPPLVQYPGVVTGTPADSAAARTFTTRRSQLEQRADSLSGVASSLAAQLSRAGKLTPAPAVPRSPTPAAVPQPDYDGEAALYKAAIARIRQNFTGAERERRLQAASDRYNERVRALATGQQP